MKKAILGLVIGVFGSLGLATASASATPAQTDITGVITESSVAVAGASVTVLCDGHTLMDTTDAHGSYLAVFPIADCAFGSTVKVTATKGGHSGVASGTVQGITTKLNLSIVNVSIPEYGLIGAIVAGGVGAGGLMFARRRMNQGATLA